MYIILIQFIDCIGADCGYIYDRDIDGGGKYFEDLKKGFICPRKNFPYKCIYDFNILYNSMQNALLQENDMLKK